MTRVLDWRPNPDRRNADYPVSTLLTATYGQRITALEKRVSILEGKVPPGPTPPPAPSGVVLWDCPIHLDQGQEGECVGFGFADFLAAQPKGQQADDALAERLYESAQALEGQTPDEQSGTSVLGGAKAAQKAGRIGSYFWAATINDVIAAIQQRSPVVLGINWYDGMFNPDRTGRIKPTGSVAGGHCLIARGYDQTTDLLTLRNSWGAGWGVGGDCTISAPDLHFLLGQQGEACVPVKV